MTNPLRAALSGIQVADFSVNLAGPFATMILADLGADVIKVERPGTGDDTRTFAPFWNGESVVFLAVNRNKRSIVLDLKSASGARLARRLATTSDVVVESFRPGVIERLGLGYEALRIENPGLIYCAISAFGEETIARERAGYDPLIQAFSGLMQMTGEPGGLPVRTAASITDLTTGLYVALAVLAAVVKRRETGTGLRISISLLDSLMSVLNHQITTVLATGHNPARMGSASPLTAPYQAVEAADGYLMVAAGNDSLFGKLADAIGLHELIDDARFTTVGARVANRPALIDAIEERTKTNAVRHWVEILNAVGVPCGPVNDLTDALGDPLIANRKVLAEAKGHPAVPDLRLVDLPFRVDGEAMGPHTAPPSLGQHTAEILELLDATQQHDNSKV